MSQEDNFTEKKRLLDFLDMLERHFSDWDDMCDCGAMEGEGEIYPHKKGCQTLNIRSDQHYAIYGERIEL